MSESPTQPKTLRVAHPTGDVIVLLSCFTREYSLSGASRRVLVIVSVSPFDQKLAAIDRTRPFVATIDAPNDTAARRVLLGANFADDQIDRLFQFAHHLTDRLQDRARAAIAENAQVHA